MSGALTGEAGSCAQLVPFPPHVVSGLPKGVQAPRPGPLGSTMEGQLQIVLAAVFYRGSQTARPVQIQKAGLSPTLDGRNSSNTRLRAVHHTLVSPCMKPGGEERPATFVMRCAELILGNRSFIL